MVDSTPRERRQARTREAILTAARQIVAQKGVAGLSMRAIARRIDYSPAGLYEYFDSKEAIIEAVCLEGHWQLMQAMRQVDENLPPAGRLLGLGLAYIAFAIHNPEAYLLMFTNPPSPANVLALMSESSSYPLLLATIEAGVAGGVFRPRPGYGVNEMAYSAWSLVHGIAMLRLTYLNDMPLDFSTSDREALQTLIGGLQGVGNDA
ncbi:MAG: TetR/AcrR family transcriptional regulator [Ardenticatenaceae bacterium]|nr:TetR/AcrR family transcriptional regulator [Anaerolineales bacterium]MCB8917327.1 TetR/AcrR family transcriptional regulator [Ardenticatenaceae bacterium]